MRLIYSPAPGVAWNAHTTKSNHVAEQFHTAVIITECLVWIGKGTLLCHDTLLSYCIVQIGVIRFSQGTHKCHG